jgi:hypothetical protein
MLSHSHILFLFQFFELHNSSLFPPFPTLIHRSSTHLSFSPNPSTYTFFKNDSGIFIYATPTLNDLSTYKKMCVGKVNSNLKIFLQNWAIKTFPKTQSQSSFSVRDQFTGPQRSPIVQSGSALNFHRQFAIGYIKITRHIKPSRSWHSSYIKLWSIFHLVHRSDLLHIITVGVEKHSTLRSCLISSSLITTIVLISLILVSTRYLNTPTLPHLLVVARSLINNYR